MNMSNDPYFDTRKTLYRDVDWSYVEAYRILLVVYGVTIKSGRLILIRQYRPPVNTTVISAPMGCFPDAPIQELLPIAAREAESETGHRILKIHHMIDFARSPGMTTEIARCFIACYSEEFTSQDLHPEEDIEVCYYTEKMQSSIWQQILTSNQLLDSTVLMCGKDLMEKLALLRQEVVVTQPESI